MNDDHLSPRDKFKKATANLPYDVMAWWDYDQMVLDGRYTFDDLTTIYEAWKRYRQEEREKVTP